MHKSLLLLWHRELTNNKFPIYLVPVKSKVKISQNFVAFSEYMNFINVVATE